MNTSNPSSLRTSPIAPVTTKHDADLLLFDLTMVPRAGAKGADTPKWCADADVPMPDAPNLAVRHPGGGLVARLAPGEVLLLGEGLGQSDWIDAAMDNLGAGKGMCFPMPRANSHAWLYVVGVNAPKMFAKVCGVDLRPGVFDDLAIAQTSVARLNAIVIRDDKWLKDKSDTPCYHVLADWTSARSLWGYLLDAMAEFGGHPGNMGHQA